MIMRGRRRLMYQTMKHTIPRTPKLQPYGMVLKRNTFRLPALTLTRLAGVRTDIALRDNMYRDKCLQRLH